MVIVIIILVHVVVFWRLGKLRIFMTVFYVLFDHQHAHAHKSAAWAGVSTVMETHHVNSKDVE